GYSVIEQRRADCNFETALMFLLADDALPGEGLAEVAENILDFLYFKSALLNRYDRGYPIGAWNWSHIKWNPSLWFDDNGWNGVIQFLIAERRSELARKYDMESWALKCAEGMLEGFDRTFEQSGYKVGDEMCDPEGIWLGDLRLPHWGALAAMAFALAHRSSGDARFADAAKRYFEMVLRERDSFIVSEDAYALIGSAFISKYSDDSLYEEAAYCFAEKIISKMDPVTGNIPAEHREAPSGEHLADLIYTVNWALLGLSVVSKREERFKPAFDKLLEFVLSIQDDSSDKQFAGCWRGMYDIKSGEWGGGDRYEGGAGSIYSGWTNAPISWVLSGLF
ncbi:MAG: hypothetical protein KAG97_07350, partial [Victivallales bacterium]|nr:hypothetical protein [Victivallales bacterium]